MRIIYPVLICIHLLECLILKLEISTPPISHSNLTFFKFVPWIKLHILALYFYGCGAYVWSCMFGVAELI